MARFESVRVVGGEKLEAALKQLSSEIRDKVLEKALRPGANLLKEEMARRAPLGKTGRLRRSMIVRKLRNAAMEVELGVGPSRDAFYGLFVEFGTGPRRTKKSAKAVGSMPAEPFARPAYDSRKDEIGRLARQILANEIEKAAKKVKF